MGFLNRLFSKYNELEQSLFEMYTDFLQSTGISRSEARQAAQHMLDQCIEESKKEGTYYLPPKFGDMLIGKVKTEDPKVINIIERFKTKIPAKKAEGVKDEDIQFFWNLNDIERRIALKYDEYSRMISFIHKRIGGSEAEEAAKRVMALHPVYGDPGDDTYGKGDDRPLPVELKDRINRYMESCASSNLEEMKKEIEQSTSFNAFIREKIRNGKI